MKCDLEEDHLEEDYLNVALLEKDGELEEDHVKDDSELEKDNNVKEEEGWQQPQGGRTTAWRGPSRSKTPRRKT